MDNLMRMIKRDKKVKIRPDNRLTIDVESADDTFAETKKILLALH